MTLLHTKTHQNTQETQRSAASFSWHGVGGHSGWAWGTGATVRAPHARLSHSGLSHDSALARAEVYLYAIWIRSEEAGVGSSSLPLGPDYDIH